jgi:hypothetical protein
MPRVITGLKQSLSPNQLILGQQNEGNRMALNLNLLLPPFCCRLPPGLRSWEFVAWIWCHVGNPRHDAIKLRKVSPCRTLTKIIYGGK